MKDIDTMVGLAGLGGAVCLAGRKNALYLWVTSRTESGPDVADPPIDSRLSCGLSATAGGRRVDSRFSTPIGDKLLFDEEEEEEEEEVVDGEDLRDSDGSLGRVRVAATVVLLFTGTEPSLSKAFSISMQICHESLPVPMNV